MKSSTPFNNRSEIESTANSGSPSHRNMSYRIEPRVGQSDFDPAFELKRLRQELIERLLIIQRKAAMNAKADKQSQLSVTIVPKPTQSASKTHLKIDTQNGYPNEPEKPSEKNPVKTDSTELLRVNRNYSNSGLAQGLPINLEGSAERIMANIESARDCISKLQVPNISQPLPKFATNKSTEQHDYEQSSWQTSTPKPQLILSQPVNEHHSHNTREKINNDIYCNINSVPNAVPNQSAHQTNQPQTPKNNFVNEPFGITLLQKLNIGLSVVGVVGILFGAFYLFSNNTSNLQPGIPVLFVGLVLIVAGIIGHFWQEYVNVNYQVSGTNSNVNSLKID
ncbi:MAG: DUF1129 domain-containing protein [Planctomycetaceae bacterium]|jgi:hypothetical protein|nr:DUF1129 domain-containing protein [Planctomycetaceae bacterium]